MKYSERGKKIDASPTLAISARARELKAAGHDVIGLGAGEPDFDTPKHIGRAGKEAIDRGYTDYTPASGTDELKKAVQNKYKRDNGLSYDLNQIIISNGAKHSLYNAFQAVLNEGDEMIIPRPYWVSYPEMVKMAGGVPVFVESGEKNNYKLNIDDLQSSISQDTKALIINSPNNPTGCVYTGEELKNIASIAVEENLLVISDEIYEEIIYDDREHVSIASLGEDIKKHTVVINGMSKAYAMTGWRIGFAAGPEEIIKIMSNMQSHATSNPNSIAQYASRAGLEGSKESIYRMVAAFQERRDYIVEKINEIPQISCIKPYGAFYIMVNVKNLYGSSYRNQKITGSMTFADILLEAEKVAAVPGKAFGQDKFIRLSYATSLENIKEGLQRLREFVMKLKESQDN